MSYLPPELIISILEYLPLKSLFRFKCVTKTWNSQISNPTHEFTIRNFNNSIFHNNNNRIAIFNDNSSLEAKEFDPNKFSKAISRFEFRTPSECSHYRYIAQIVGCCNGIVAVFSRYNAISDEVAQLSNNYNTCFDLTLWNPFVKTHLHIPLVEFPCELTSDSVFGFGCIALNDKDYDYKIVRVTDFCNHHGNKTREVIVYSSNRNCWGLPCVVEDVKDCFRLYEPGVLINSNVHWIFCTPTGFDFIDVHCLRGFDLSLEKWIDLPLPNLSSVRDFYDLHALDGCLCLMVTQVVDYGFDVWVMKEYGVQNSWAPLFSMSDISNCTSLLSPPFASSKDGHGHEFLVRLDGRGYCSPCEFLWLNLRDKSVKEVPGLMPWDVIVCSESLIRVPNGVPDNSQ